MDVVVGGGRGAAWLTSRTAVLGWVGGISMLLWLLLEEALFLTALEAAAAVVFPLFFRFFLVFLFFRLVVV